MNFPGILISPIIQIMKCLCAPIVQRILYVKDLRKNFEMLNEKARDLLSKKDDVKEEIRRHGTEKMATRECENWLNKVEAIEKQINEIEEKYNEEDRRCLWCQCLNIQSQWKLGKTVVVTMNRTSDLVEESAFVRRAMVDALPKVVETVPALTIGDDTSANQTLCKILECVKNPAKHKIGVWGMGGVGKTTLMKNLNNLPEVKRIFEIVIWVTVSKDCSIRRVQNEIAVRLQVSFLNNESDERAARKLYEHLQTKRFLLLMDDLWDKVDLDNVGVPCPNQNGSTVVLTTRYRKVCNKMETDEEIKVKPLPLKEAWELFREKAGDVVDLPSIQLVARSVVAECGGLPLAIIVIGASLRKEDDVHVWSNALKELTSPATSNLEDMEEQVFKRLKFSFDRLKDDNLKSCFLYASLYPEDYLIPTDEIIDYWMVEGFISSSLNLVEKRNKGHSMLKELIDASLLESTDIKLGVNYMHDVIRDLAVRIASAKEESYNFFVRSGARIKQLSDNNEWEQVERISLMMNELGELPERPYCPTLLTLLLQWNKKLTRIPDLFFEHMHSLRVLDLSSTDIESLPRSIRNLVNLRGLYLRRCFRLKTLPSEIGALTSLEVLDARESRICNLPCEIGELAHLRVLQLLFPSIGEYESATIASSIIERLSQLEQLCTIGEFMGCFMGFDEAPDCAVAVIDDVCCLKELKSLQFLFPEVTNLEYFLRTSSPWKEGSILTFHFVVGMVAFYDLVFGNEGTAIPAPQENSQSNNILTFRGGINIPSAIMEVLARADSFHLVSHRSISKLSQFGIENMDNLRECSIYNCIGVEAILDGAWITRFALPNLETLYICKLPNLKSIWDGPLPDGSLARLRKLRVLYCHKLKKIFSRETIRQLSNLEDLTVQHCSSLKEVITEEVSCMMFECGLPKLRHLCVANLPALVGISKGCSLTLLAFEELKVCYCPKLKRLPEGICKASNLSKITCNGEWWDELEWDDNAIKVQLEVLVSRDYGIEYSKAVFC